MRTPRAKLLYSIINDDQYVTKTEHDFIVEFGGRRERKSVALHLTENVRFISGVRAAKAAASKPESAILTFYAFAAWIQPLRVAFLVWLPRPSLCPLATG
jgi:hypothetical protein